MCLPRFALRNRNMYRGEENPLLLTDAETTIPSLSWLLADSVSSGLR